MPDNPIDSFLVDIGFARPNASSARAAVDTVNKVERDITATQSAEMDKRIAAELRTGKRQTSIKEQLGKLIESLEQDRADRVDAIQKDQAERASKRDAEEVKKATVRRDALLKSTRALAVGMTSLLTGLAAGITGSATGLMWATDRAAKHFERLAYAGQAAGSSAAGISRFAYQASQLGASVEDAQSSLAAFGDNLKTLPAMEGMLKNMGIATRDANGHLRDAGELAAEYIDHLKALPKLQREAQASGWGIQETVTRAMIRPEAAGFGREYDRIQGTVGADPNAAAQGAIGFEQAMRRGFEIIGAVKTRVETALFELIKPRLDDISKWVLDHGEAISNVVTSITKGLTDLATAFVKSDVVQNALTGLGDGLERMAKYVGSDAFKKDVQSFVDDVKALARSIRDALEWLGVLPSRSGAAVVPDPKGDHDGPNRTDMGLYGRWAHGRNAGDISQGQIDRAREKFHAFGGEGGSRAWRNNNPGNISAGKFAQAHGADGSDGRFAHFPTYEAGRKAQEALWFNSDLYKGKTLAGAVTQWSPPGENDTAGLIRKYATAAGVDPNTPLSQFTPEQRKKLLDAQQAAEGWQEGRRQNSVDTPKVAGDSPEVAEARRYLAQTATGAAAQRADSIVKLNPAFALAAAKAIKQARAEGINAGIGSGYRSFGQTGSAYDAQGYSGHSYGLASDFSGIGAPGSVEARRFDEISRAAGLGGYGPDNPREWNHKELGQHLQHDADRLARMRATLGPNGEMIDPQATWAASGYVLPRGAGEQFPQVAKAALPPLATRTFGNYLAQSGAGAPQKPGSVPDGEPRVSDEDYKAALARLQGFRGRHLSEVERAQSHADDRLMDRYHTQGAVPVKVEVSENSAIKIGKGFASSFPAGTVPHGSNPLADLHASWQRYAETHSKEVVHPGETHPALKVPPSGVTPSLYHAYDNSRTKGDTNIHHAPTFNIHGGDAKGNMDHARMVADRGTRDLVRNLKTAEQ